MIVDAQLFTDDDTFLAPSVSLTRTRSFLRVDVQGRRSNPSLSGSADKINLSGSANKERNLTGDWES